MMIPEIIMVLPGSFCLKIQQDIGIYNRWFGRHIRHHFYMDQFRIRLYQFHNDVTYQI